MGVPAVNVAGVAIFEAYIKWGRTSEEVPRGRVPKEFREAKRIRAKAVLAFENLTKNELSLSAKEMKKRLAEVDRLVQSAIDLVSPFLSCTFTADNLIPNASEIFNVPKFESVSAKKVKIYKMNFAGGDLDLPSIKATARFRFRTRRPLTTEYIESWQEENDDLWKGISFSWNIPRVDQWFDMDHSGLSMEMVSFKPKVKKLLAIDILP